MSPPILLLLTNARGEIQSVSPALCELTGYTEQELIGRELAFLLAAETEQPAAQYHALLKGDHLASARILLRAKNRLTLAVTIAAAPLLDERGATVATAYVVQDASAHHAFQPATHQELPILRAALESTADAILVIDSSFQVVTCNRKFEELWGLPEGWAARPEYKNLLEALKQQVKEPEAFVRRIQEIYRQQVDTGFEWFEMLDGRIIERFSSAYRVGDQIGGRVWNYRDRTTLERAHYEVNTLKTIAETLNHALTPHEALSDGLAMVVRLFGAHAGWIRGLEEAGAGELVVEHTPPGWADGPQAAEPYALCTCLRNISAGHPPERAMLTCEYLRHARQAVYLTPYQICIPIETAGQTTGILMLLAPAQRAYSEADTRLFQSISNQFGLALERARLFAAEQAQRKTAETLYEVTSALNATIEIAAVLQNVVRRSVEVVSAAGGFLGLLTQDGAELSVAHSFNFDPAVLGGSLHRGEGLSWSVVERGESLLINAYPAYPHALPEIIALGVRAAISVPVAAGKQRLGVLTVFTQGQDRRFTQSDLLLLEAIGKQAGVAIQNARLYAEVQSLAIQDPLTGLYNQRYLFSAGEQEFARAQRYNHPLAACILDIDHFKRVNDTYGHELGNRVLRAIADLCRAQLRASDLIVRYGGEEFVVLLLETAMADALEAARRLCARIAQTPIETDQGAVAITVSIGVAALGGAAAYPGLSALLQQADMALYDAKRAGRNRVCARP